MSAQPQITMSSLPLPAGRAEPGTVVGIIAMAVTVVIWAGFALTTRASHASALAFGDVALIRALVPTLVLLPFLPARIGMIRRAGVLNCLVIATGAGTPFLALAVAGGAVTSAAHVAALIAGMAPVFIALVIRVLTGQGPSRRGVMALAITSAGAALLVAAEGGMPPWGGVATLLCASLLWAAYTIAMRGSGLDPVGCALVIAIPSSIAVLALIWTGAVDSNWGTYTLTDALPYLLIQGLGVGIVSTLTYTFAITRLGPAMCSTMGAAAPALAALMAVPLLQEDLGALDLMAVGAICAGIVLYNRR